MKKKLVTGLLAVLFMLGMLGMAEAYSFEVTSSIGIFLNPVGGTNSGVGTSIFKTGTPYNNDDKPTSLEFTGVSLDVDDILSGSPFVFGKLIYFNGTTKTDSTAEKVDLEVSLDFTFTCDYFIITIPKKFLYPLTFDMTQNANSDDADSLFFPTTQPSAKFSVNGDDYTLAFRVLDENGLIEDKYKFNIDEGKTSSAKLWGQFTQCTLPVPIPGAIWLFASGLAGLIGFRKKQQNYKPCV